MNSVCFFEDFRSPAHFCCERSDSGRSDYSGQIRGDRHPEALAVLGVDNYEPICEHTVPTLSSIEPDFRRGGNLAALMLLARFRAKEGYQGKRHHSFGPFRIVRRASTRLLVQTDKSVLEALDFIRREACNGLTAARVARLFPCSRRQAEIRFRKATGHSILDEIHAVQLDRAKQLLKDPNIQLKAISIFAASRIRTPCAISSNAQRPPMRACAPPTAPPLPAVPEGSAVPDNQGTGNLKPTLPSGLRSAGGASVCCPRTSDARPPGAASRTTGFGVRQYGGTSRTAEREPPVKDMRRAVRDAPPY